MKRALLVLAAGCVVLSGCGGGDSSPAPITIAPFGTPPPPPERDASGRITAPADAALADLRPGDCFDESNGLVVTVQSYHLVPCDAPHKGEIIAAVEYEGGPDFPGPDALRKFAQKRCVSEFKTYVGVPAAKSKFFAGFVTPEKDSWTSGEHTVLCVGGGSDCCGLNFSTPNPGAAGKIIKGSIKDARK
jgi:hypothetical protein